MLERSPEEESLVCKLNWEALGFLGVAEGSKELVSVDKVEVEVVGEAVSTYRVVADPESGLVADFEHLEHEQEKLVGEHLGQARLRKQ